MKISNFFALTFFFFISLILLTNEITIQNETLVGLARDFREPIRQEMIFESITEQEPRTSQPGDIYDYVYDGYIIELELTPLLVRERELKEMTDRRGNKLSDREIQRELEQHKELLKKEKEEIKKKIIDEFSKEKYYFGSVLDKDGLLKIDREFNLLINGFSMRIGDEEAHRIKNMKGVKNIHENYFVRTAMMDSVPQIQGGIAAGQVDANGNDCTVTGQPCITGQGVTIAVLDTGVDYTHPSLGGCFGAGCKVIGGYNFVDNNTNPMDHNNHGTAVAGIAAGNGVLKGVAPDANILAYKVLNSQGVGTYANVISGLEQAIIDDADVILLSLYKQIFSINYFDPIISDNPLNIASNNAVLLGYPVVTALGFGLNSVPGSASEVITVGAIDKNDELTSIPGSGPVVYYIDDEIVIDLKPDVVAPGLSICAPRISSYGTLPCVELPGDTNYWYANSHSSISAAHVAGAIALLKQKHPAWTPQEIKASIKETNTDLGFSIINQGTGKININELIKLNTPLEESFYVYLYEVNKIYNIYDSHELYGFFPEDYDFLNVSWRKKPFMLQWKTDGITLNPQNHYIGTFNPENTITQTGEYEFKLTVTKDGVTKEYITTKIFHEKLLPGFPFKPRYAKTRINSLISSDINKDGFDEIVFTGSSPGGSIHAINHNGYVQGFPYRGGNIYLENSTLIEGLTVYISDVIIDDLNKNGYNDFIVTSSRNRNLNVPARIAAVSYGGDLLWNRTISDYTLIGELVSADITGNGFPEIMLDTTFIDGTNVRIWVLNNEGDILWNLPLDGYFISDYDTNLLGVADVTGDGFKEIIYSTLTEQNSNQRYFYIINKDGDTIFQTTTNYAYVGLDYLYNSPVYVFADIMSNERNEIIILESTMLSDQELKGNISIIKYENGEFVKETLYELDSGMPMKISVGDVFENVMLDGRKRYLPEIIFVRHDREYLGAHSYETILELNVIDYKGDLLLEIPLSNYIFGIRESLIGDVTGDGYNEIILFNSTFNSGKMIVVNRFGEVIEEMLSVSSYGTNYLLVDLENDGKYEIAAIGLRNVYLWNLTRLDQQINRKVKGDWPMIRSDAQKTGDYKYSHCDLPSQLTVTVGYGGFVLVPLEDTPSGAPQLLSPGGNPHVLPYYNICSYARLSAIPNSGFTFNRWLNEIHYPIGTSENITLHMHSHRMVTATFTEISR